MTVQHRCVVYVSSFMWFRTSVSLLRGDGEIRTLDPLLARQVLSQLSYAPILVYMLLEAYI